MPDPASTIPVPWLGLIAVLLLGLGCTAQPAPPSQQLPTPGSATAEAPRTERPSISFVGQAILPPGLEVDGTKLGGISGITYDPVERGEDLSD